MSARPTRTSPAPSPATGLRSTPRRMRAAATPNRRRPGGASNIERLYPRGVGIADRPEPFQRLPDPEFGRAGRELGSRLPRDPDEYRAEHPVRFGSRLHERPARHRDPRSAAQQRRGHRRATPPDQRSLQRRRSHPYGRGAGQSRLAASRSQASLAEANLRTSVAQLSSGDRRRAAPARAGPSARQARAPQRRCGPRRSRFNEHPAIKASLHARRCGRAAGEDRSRARSRRNWASRLGRQAIRQPDRRRQRSVGFRRGRS